MAAVLELGHIGRFYLWENRRLKDLQRLNENEMLGMKDFASLDFKANFLKMIDEDAQIKDAFFAEFPYGADTIS